ncbi:MAG: 50S ribosomal protein P1 [Candidatus Altiarchaeota archaeon]|nr:50S ribosomal protein P1 [Candidatus Altiarchaeota archaeon]
MEYVYGAMLLHSAGQKVDETNLTKVLKAGGVKADTARVKALVASLDGVDIDEAIKTAAPVAAAPAASAAPAAETEAKGEAKKKDKKAEVKTEEEAASGLASLFG